MAYNMKEIIANKPSRFSEGHRMCAGCGAPVVARHILRALVEKGILKRTENFEDFLLGLFLIPAYCMLFSRNKLGSLYNSIGELQEEKMKTILDSCELKDSVNLTNITLGKIFGPKNLELNYNNWKNLFERHNIDYMLSPQGIRIFLEKYNI